LNWWQREQTESGGRAGDAAVAPSVLACDFSDLAGEIAKVESAGADLLHLDVMDGRFVPNITFGPCIVEAISRMASIPLDTHLMIASPERYLDRFVDAGSHVVTVHVEASEDPARDLRAIRARGARAGLACNPDNDFGAVRPFLDEMDLLLFMSVFPGFGGQKFMDKVLPRADTAATERERLGLDYVIEMDGGINPRTASRARDAGVDILVAGTAVFGAGDYADAITGIRGG